MELKEILKASNILEEMKDKEKEDLKIDIDKFTKIDIEEHNKRIDNYKDMIEASRSEVDDPEKTFPWEGASNIKYPIALTESNASGSMLSTAILQDQIVKGVVIGEDEKEVIDESKEGGVAMQPLGKKDRAERVAQYVNYLLKYKIPNWEDNQDYTLQILSFLGAQFKKTYWSDMENCVKSELVDYKDIIISNSASIETADRITHRFKLTRSEIIGRQRAGIYIECDLEEEKEEFTILETHLYYDLDDDGISEPYIYTHIEKGEMLSLQKRYDDEMINYNDKEEIISVDAENHFTKYGFIRDIKDPIYDIGFGQLIIVLNKLINTMYNQLVDAGTLANTSGGLISGGSGIKSGNSMRLKQGEWKVLNNVMDIKNNIMEISGKEPSPTLFSLLDKTIQACKDITSIKNLNPESISSNMPATTTLYMVEQGLTEFKAIYKRIHRSLKSEVDKILYFIKKYGDIKDYLDIMDYGEASKEDLEKDDDYEIVPVNSSSSLTDGQTMMRANAVYQSAIAGNNPYINLEEATEYYFKSINIDSYENIMQEPPAPQPNPIEEAMAMNQIELGKAQNNLLNSQAESTRLRDEIAQQKQYIDTLTAKNKAMNETLKARIDAMEKYVSMQKEEPDLSQEKKEIKDLSGTLGVNNLKKTNPFGGNNGR